MKIGKKWRKKLTWLENLKRMRIIPKLEYCTTVNDFSLSLSLSLHVYIYVCMCVCVCVCRVWSVNCRQNYAKKMKMILTSYFPDVFTKITKNILKYYRLNLFKANTTGFNQDLQATFESPASLSNDLLF